MITIKKINFRSILIVYLLFWIIASFILIKHEGLRLSSIDKMYDHKAVVLPSSNSLAEGEKITGSFKSTYPYLNGITINFQTFGSHLEDNLEFRLKPKSSDKWYITENISTKQLTKDKSFTIWFPQIRFSANRDYVFELKLLNSGDSGGVTVDTRSTSFITRHTLTWKQLSNNHEKIIYLLLAKTENIFLNLRILSTLLIYLTPLIYVSLILFLENKTFITACIILFSCFLDIFLFGGKQDFLVASIVFGWIILTLRARISSTISVIIYIVFIGFTLLFSLFGMSTITERLGVWIYIFLFCSVLGKLLENYYHIEPRYGGGRLIEKLLLYVPPKTRSIVIKNLSFINIKLKDNYKYKFINLFSFLRGRFFVETSKFIKKYHYIWASLFNIVFTLISYLLLRVVIGHLLGILNFYESYFQHHQILELYKRTGMFIAIFYILLTCTLVIGIAVIKKFRKTMILVYIFVLLYGSDYIFDKTTLNLRNKIVIWEIKPSVITDIWVDVTITGINFTDNINGGAVRINGVNQRIMSWKDREIVFRTDPEKTMSGNLEVDVFDQHRNSNSIAIDYKYKR